MKKAFFPGSFDPPTNGHINLIERAAKIFDELHIVIANNQEKKCFFSAHDRLLMMTEILSGYENVKLHIWDKLIVDFAHKNEIYLMIRGVRALADFSYEFELAMTNKTLMPELDVLFMPTDPKYFVLRSSAIRDIASLGGEIETMVPPIVADALFRNLKK